MIVIAGFIIGAIGGGLRARARKGNRLDIAQYAFVFGMIFALFGLFLTLFLERML
ncbi:MAG: hypothetical protein V3U96_07030 [Paracoccaceae bacterium]